MSEAEGGVDQADDEIGQELAGHQLHRGDRRGDQQLHGAALPLARDGERGELRADERHDQRDDAGDDEVPAVQVLVVPDPGLSDGGDDGLRLTHALGPLELDIAGIGADHRLGVAERDVGGVGVGGVEDRLHRGGVGGGEVFREVLRDDDRHVAAARVDGAGDAGVVALGLDDGEIVRSLERLEQRLALLAALAVEGADRHVLDVEVDAVAEQHHLHERHQEHHHEAARVAQDLQHLLPGDRLDPAQVHGAGHPAVAADELDEHVLQRRLDRLDPRPGEAALGEPRLDRRPVARRVLDDDVQRRAEQGDVARARRALSASSIAPGSSPSTSRISPRIAPRLSSEACRARPGGRG